MIKHINHQNVSTAPFVATKARALYNIQGDETIITEPNVYADGTHISLDYVDYNFGDPVLNTPYDASAQAMTFVFNEPQTKTNLQTLTLQWKWTWDRVIQ